MLISTRENDTEALRCGPVAVDPVCAIDYVEAGSSCNGRLLEQSSIDRPSFGARVATIIVVCIPLAALPDTAGALLQKTYDFINFYATSFSYQLTSQYLPSLNPTSW